MAAAVPLRVPGSAGHYIPDWRKRPGTIAARNKMMTIILRNLSRIRGMVMSEALNHAAAVEEELFYQSNSLHEYIDKKTLPDRISMASQRKLVGYAVSTLKNTCSHAEASHLIGAQYKSGSFLLQQTWAEHPASARRYWQGASDVIVYDDVPPPLDTDTAAHLVSPVGSSCGSAAFCYHPHVVTPVDSLTGNPTFCDPSLTPHGGSVYGARASPTNCKQTPHGTLFSNNLAGGQYSQYIRGKNIVNVLDDPWTEQSGASARKYQRGRSNVDIINATPPPLDTYPTEYQVFPVGSSSGITGNPPGPPPNCAVHGGWAAPCNGKRGRDGLPRGNYSSGIPGGQYLQSILHHNILRHQDVPLNYPAVVCNDHLVSPGGTPCRCPRLSDSPNLLITGAASGRGINLQEGKWARHGPTFGNHSSESAAILHLLYSTEQSVPVRQYVNRTGSEHIVQGNDATPTSEAIVGVEYPVSHAGTSHGSTSAFSNSRCPAICTVNRGGVSLEGSKETRDGLSSGKGLSQGEVAVLRPIHSTKKYQRELQRVINNTHDRVPEIEDLPAPVSSVIGTSDFSDLLKKHEWADERLPSLQNSPESQFPDDPLLNKTVVINLTDDDESQLNPVVGPVHLEELPGFSAGEDSKTRPSLEDPLICHELKVPVELEFMDMVEVTPHDNMEASAITGESKISTDEENTRVQEAQYDWNETPEDEILETENITGKSLKMESSDLFRVSLTESLSEEQILEHLSSLGNSIGMSSGDDAMKSFSENTCRICRKEKIFFEPAPCSCCGTKMKKNGVYYSLSDKEGSFKLCRLCYDRSGKKSDKTFNKEKLCKMIAKEGIEEDWVQCDKCQGWQHQICTLYNRQKDKGGKAKYTCPLCCLKEIRSGDRLPSEVGAINARNLPRTALSDHIEKRLRTRLKEDRELRANEAGKGFLEVPGAEDLTVRVVLTEKKTLKVKEEFLNLFNPTDYPSEFPYTSKMILLFQKIGVVDVILFGFYAEEYGSDCGDPNSRCIYISYLDSIKYFSPSAPTATGEALRTFAFHEILIGYLDYCKKRGFVSCHIWSCPPRRGQDYLFYNHPENQRTPTAPKLTNWYQTMRQKAAKEKVVVSHSNIYDCHFLTSRGSHYEISATRLPYFEGDSWFNFAGDVLKEVDKESKSNYQRKKVKVGTKHKAKAVPCTDSLYDSKDFLFMQKLGRILQQNKKDFIVIRLRHVCSHCHQAISSGQGWFCNGCTDFSLCERCHDGDSSVSKSHRSNKGKQHLLSKVAVDILPSSTDEEDGVIENLLLRSRHQFLKFCQQKHYQFDTLRRAKHSSMMVLHFLSWPNDLSECSICAETSLLEEHLTCETCPNLHVRSPCKQREGFSHSHPPNHGSDS